MRRGNKPEAEDYIKVRLEFLHEEKKKNDNQTAHLVLDKAIYELSIVLDLITRNGDQRSLVAHLVWDQRVAGSNPASPTNNKDYVLWTLVFIYLYAGEPFSVKYDAYDNMTDCFFAREKLGEELSGRSGYFLEGSQAVCIYEKISK